MDLFFGAFLSMGVLPIGSWGGAEFPFEIRVELGEVREADLRGDLADGDGTVDEEARGVAELCLDEVFVGRAAEILFEEAVQLDARVVEPLAEVGDRIKQERGLQGELVHGARERGLVLGHLNHVEVDPLDGEQGGGFGDVIGLKARGAERVGAVDDGFDVEDELIAHFVEMIALDESVFEAGGDGFEEGV